VAAREVTAFEPTDEQVDVLGLFLSGIDLAVEAGAGTGKTTTLQLLGRETRRTGFYVAFNRAIVNEARMKMPMNVGAQTAHSLAFRQVGAEYAHRLESERMKSWHLAKALDIGPVVVETGTAKKVLQPGYLASHVLRGIRNFCMSADPEPTPWHLPVIHAIDPPREDGRRRWVNNDNLRLHLADALARAWVDICNVDGRLPFTHDHYLKLWSLRDPVIPGEFILVDEAQDLSPVMLVAVERQVTLGKQVVFVGDSQQQIYGWRGAVNALAAVPADATAYLTQSWRFGEPIAAVANLILDRLNADLRLVGHPGMTSMVGPALRPDAILCRGNSAALEHVLHLQRQGRKPHLVGGGTELLSFAKGVHDLQTRGKSSHPDLACFDSWAEVKEYAERDPQGDDLAMMVGLIDEYGLQIVLDALDGMIAEEAADVIVSTAHKAKGREWDSVRLAPDFPDPTRRGGDGEADEWRLLYVAATRARVVLDPMGCEPIRTLLGAARAAAAPPMGSGSPGPGAAALGAPGGP
jgi:hypothetical protein